MAAEEAPDAFKQVRRAIDDGVLGLRVSDEELVQGTQVLLQSADLDPWLKLRLASRLLS